MAKIHLLLGIISLYSWRSTAENASLRWVEVDGNRLMVVNLAFGPGTFYIMNIRNMSNIVIENGETRVMDRRDYQLVRKNFGDYPMASTFAASGAKGKSGNSEHQPEKHAAHDRWYKKALKRYNAQKAKMEFHMHDELW